MNKIEVINSICFDCGYKYLTRKQKEGEGRIVTAHEGICCECEEKKLVTSARHYNYQNKKQ